jgi:superfamily I DNA and/or RNA helicase
LGIPDVMNITIDTVERFQGSQRRYIIYGFTIQKHYQLRFLTNNTFMEDGKLIDRKLNVAMTRAQEHLIMIGNPAILESNPLIREVISYSLECRETVFNHETTF